MLNTKSEIRRVRRDKKQNKVKRIKKPYARKIQILTVMEQRAKVMGKTQVVAIAKKAKEQLKKAHKSG